jgi:hypothetical protein
MSARRRAGHGAELGMTTTGRKVAMNRFGLVLIVTLALAGSPFRTAMAADEARPLPPFGESVKIMLDASVGRAVTLHLASGQEISGTVTRVGDHVVHLSRIAGRDFYDAVVVLDRVNAVLFKVVGR